MSQVWLQIRRIAPHVRTVLLTGEPDCGQEAVARVLLDLSAAPQRSFIKITAGEADARLERAAGLSSLPADVLLFVPDLHRFSTAAAEALLRLLRLRRSRFFTLVAATSEDPRALATAGRIPAELAEMLTVVRVHVPCLRDRMEDVPMLLGHLLAAHAETQGVRAPRLAEDLHRAAMRHTWPGNLRELSRVADLLASPSDSPERGELTAADLQDALACPEPATTTPEAVPARMVSLDTVVYEHINSVLRGCRGNKLRAAEVLGISRSTLYRMLDAAAAQTAALPLAS